MGLDAYANSRFPFFTLNTMGCEYPNESMQEHLLGAGILIGALLDTGTSGQPKFTKAVLATEVQPLLEAGANWTSPVDTNNPWYRTSILNLNEPNHRSVDDDGDGKIDEDELDGIDSDGDGKIDEDYAAFSESDYYCAYTDSFHTFHERTNLHPLGVKIWQRSYAWANAVREPVLPVDYYLVNVGKKRLDSVYIGFNIWPTVGPLSKGIIQERNFVGYWAPLRTAYVHNPLDIGSTPIGFTLLETAKPLVQLKFFFTWWPFYNTISWFDIIDNQGDLYDYLRGKLLPNEPAIKPNQSLTDIGLYYLQFSFGPFETWDPGETLKVSLALVSGHSLEFGPDNLYDNARFAQTLYQRHYKPPIVLPAPKLNFEYGENNVTITWSPSASSRDPQDEWDEENSLASFYQPDHWRRRNPPPGMSKGGRVFEGYRLYRSEDPAGTANSFTLLKQWDVIDSVGPKYGYDTGIETTFVDSNLHTNKTYWYAVTSFGIPDLHVIDYLDFDGVVKKETLNTPSAETSVLASRKRVNLPFAVSSEPNKVLVVPNPYRVDENYTYEGGGWEGRGKTWNENKRLLKFIHLPPKCTIRIYSLVGDIIATLLHDNPVRGELDWNLLSESNRAIASGVYVFSVESEYGMQIGKFAVIR